MYGMDISNYQAGIDLSKGNYDFCIIKATEGISFTDKSFNNFVVQLTKLDKLVGCYHFARPDLHGTVEKMQQEADWFCSEIKRVGWANKAILVLDWETEPMDRPDLIEAWVNRVKELMGYAPFIYTSRYKLSMWKDYEIVKNSPIWMAVWPNTVKYSVGENPNLSFPTSAYEWKIWQYSSTGTYPGYSGRLDLDYSKLSKEEWIIAAGGKKEEEKPEVLSEDMKWAISMGLFAGYGNGKYGPNDPLTRGQAATVLHRFFDIINEHFG